MGEPTGSIEALFFEMYTPLVRIAYREIGDQRLAEEIVQEAFMAWIARGGDVSGHPNPRGWLTTTVHNKVKNEKRRLSFDEVSLEAVRTMEAAAEDCSLADILPRQMTEAEKQVLLWHYRDKLTYRDIANHMGWSESACQCYISRLLKKCKKYLEPS